MKKIVMLLIAVLLFGCAKNNPEVQKPVEKPQVEEPTEQDPLTGIMVKKVSTERTVAVMISNHPKARPQSGLVKADIVYEVLAEGNITRFLAVFHSEMPKIIGPVRSAREYYLELNKGYDAFFICHGWSPQAKEILEAGGADFLNGLFYDGTLFQRASYRKAPHNSYITSEHIIEGAEKRGYEIERPVESLMFFENNFTENATSIQIKYGKAKSTQVKYEYDQTLHAFKRSDGGVPMSDYDTKEPAVISNVLVVEAHHKIIDSSGRRSIDLQSGGKAYLFQDGKGQLIRWENIDGRILPYADGNQLGLLPGKTWINIVPSLKDMTYESGGSVNAN